MASWDLPNGPIVEEEGCQIHGVADGFSLRASFRDGSIEAKGEEEWAQGVALLHTPREAFLSEQHTSHYPGQARRYSSDFARRAGPIHLVEGVLQLHGLEAPFVVVVVFPKPTSDGVGDGFTAGLGFEPQ